MFSLIPRRRPEADDTALAAFRHQMDDLFENFFKGDWSMALPSESSLKVDVSETEQEIDVRADCPGFQADDIDIELGDGCLFIRGEHKDEQTEEDKERKYHRVERRHASFSRSVPLPCMVDEERITAELADGVLNVKLAKVADAQRKKISVKG